jgi:hypothetical protein
MSKTLENINSISLSSILLCLKSAGCGTWSGSYDLPNQTRIWRLWFSFLGEEPKIFQWEKIHIVTWTGEGNCCTWWRDLKPEIQSIRYVYSWSNQVQCFLVWQSMCTDKCVSFESIKLLVIWACIIGCLLDSYQRCWEICKHCQIFLL